MKNPSLDISQMKTSASHAATTVLRYHVIISVVAITSFLIFSVITVNAILSGTKDTAYEQQQQASVIKTKFDDATIDKINDLRSRVENPSLELPENGRRNPFKE